MKTVIHHALYGLCIGSTTYLLFSLVPGNFNVVYSRTEVISVMLMSVLIGLLSLIFQVERLKPLVALLIHAVGTFGLVLFTGVYNQWFTWQTAIQQGTLPIVIAYLLIWLVLEADQLVTLRRINRRLAQTRRNR
ncbi:DUF3021 domain-containing protein [Furfurilactobacillus siliginis]|uniref:DUF3021 domain-containing protein n=1 Tax=Furfurilactobacillus siliginis TaxID=348151 RepID=A0A0R2L3U0_9LACO|nr:DUF3021 domain-containing protein [Furfurilactobacillus siliginis]KRN96415.1 hypothetical protein IV55_GL001384 [Furfurilactobacillus siliginis]GEK29203.1 hypothetical protein LSI01_15140 [Furfurilactobacillus siliginis]